MTTKPTWCGGGESTTIAIVLSADPERELVIEIEPTNRHGASDNDYSGVPESVTFNSGETRQTFSFEAEVDDDDDAWEAVEIRFRSPLPDGVSTATPASTTVSIVDAAPRQLVSNAAKQSHFHGYVGVWERAQGFKTGTNHSGYTITAASVVFHELPGGTSADHFQLLLWPANAAGTAPARPWHSQLGEFLNPDNLATGNTGERKFQARHDVHLDPSTQYYLVMRTTAGRHPRVVSTSQSAESTADGWTIDNNLSYRLTNTRDNWTVGSAKLKIRVAGYARPDQTHPTLVQATVDRTSLVLTYDEPLERISAPASSAFAVSANGTSNTVSSVGVNGATVTLTLETEISATDTATLSYSPPPAYPLRDPAGHLAAPCVVLPGSPATGNVSTPDDQDVFRVSLERNRQYTFEVRGKYTGHGTLEDPRLWISWPGDLDDWLDPNILTGGSPDGGSGKNELYEFDTALDGTEWRFRVGGNDGTGTYTLVLTDISNAIFTSPDRITVPENTTAHNQVDSIANSKNGPVSSAISLERRPRGNLVLTIYAVHSFQRCSGCPGWIYGSTPSARRGWTPWPGTPDCRSRKPCAT